MERGERKKDRKLFNLPPEYHEVDVNHAYSPGGEMKQTDLFLLPTGCGWRMKSFINICLITY